MQRHSKADSPNLDRAATLPPMRDDDQTIASSYLRRKDTLRGPPLRILSLDGGGVRGYSMLILLQELMHRTYVEMEGEAPRKEEIPKPCDHFDLIIGTGTGGLIAIMLGRLRLDLETCKEVYTRMTRKVFETDKTIAGIPYKSTMFKASKLEEAIRECVREHTVFEHEGGIGKTFPGAGPVSRSGSAASHARRSSISGTMRPAYTPTGGRMSRWGDPNALLYDSRENRTKTAVTAVYKGSTRGSAPALLRSYDSRKEPAPEFECSIWQAGRATCATGLAFKPITIGQSVFTDEGGGRYNPAPLALDEAVLNEWPGRNVGIFVSIGTGKRPTNSKQSEVEWWESYVGDNLSNFAEARRRLVAKIEGCEDTHKSMLTTMLPLRNVPLENYVRLNVEVGVGEFGMNEWNRLADISTSTRRYLAKQDVQDMNSMAAKKLASINHMKRSMRSSMGTMSFKQDAYMPSPLNSPATSQFSQSHASDFVPMPTAIELPAGDVDSSLMGPPGGTQPNTPARPPAIRMPSANDKFTIVSSDEYPQPMPSQDPPSNNSLEITPRTSADIEDYYRDPNVTISPRHSGYNKPAPVMPPPLPPRENPPPPPRPPKTPLLGPGDIPPGRRSGESVRSRLSGQVLLEEDEEAPPPAVNRQSKPNYDR